jgi:hypothetical protein
LKEGDGKDFAGYMEIKESIGELYNVNNTSRLKEISQSNLGKIRKLNFLEYDAKKLGDNFA